MNKAELILCIKDIIADAVKLKNKYTDLYDISVNYACIFAHSEAEYSELYELAQSLGNVVHKTEMGDIFMIEPIQSVAGMLYLLKVRKPDPAKTGRGYADLTVPDYNVFKKKYLNNPAFKLTDRGEYEMIGLKDAEFDVAVYFMNPPMDKMLGIKSKLS